MDMKEDGGRSMSHTEFAHLLSSINALSPEQMRQLSRELETRLAEIGNPPPAHGQGSLVAMRDADDELDEAVAHAMRLRESSRNQPPTASSANAGEDTPDPILGLMRDDAELMDEIVADAYRRRREEKWRDIDL
jgi:hypothetical protein